MPDYSRGTVPSFLFQKILFREKKKVNSVRQTKWNIVIKWGFLSQTEQRNDRFLS